MSTKTQQTPWERLRSQYAAEAIAKGEIKVPIRCSWCSSENVHEDRSKDAPRQDGKPTEYVCVTCGRVTKIAEARKLRRQQIRRTILEGVDPPALRAGH